MRTGRRVLAAMVLVASGCEWLGLGGGSSDEPEDPTGEVSSLVGVEGGTLSVAGVELHIPPGALQEPTELTLTVTLDGIEGHESLTPMVTIGPDGLELAEAAELLLPSLRGEEATGTDPVVLWSADDSPEFMPIPTERLADGSLRVFTRHFSRYLGVVPGYAACVDDALVAERFAFLGVCGHEGVFVDDELALAWGIAEVRGIDDFAARTWIRLVNVTPDPLRLTRVRVEPIANVTERHTGDVAPALSTDPGRGWLKETSFGTPEWRARREALAEDPEVSAWLPTPYRIESFYDAIPVYPATLADATIAYEVCVEWVRYDAEAGPVAGSGCATYTSTQCDFGTIPDPASPTTCVPGERERCMGGRDEDGDGAVDCEDSDCARASHCDPLCLDLRRVRVSVGQSADPPPRLHSSVYVGLDPTQCECGAAGCQVEHADFAYAQEVSVASRLDVESEDAAWLRVSVNQTSDAAYNERTDVGWCGLTEPMPWSWAYTLCSRLTRAPDGTFSASEELTWTGDLSVESCADVVEPYGFLVQGGSVRAGEIGELLFINGPFPLTAGCDDSAGCMQLLQNAPVLIRVGLQMECGEP